MKLATGIGLLLAAVLVWRAWLFLDAATALATTSARAVEALPKEMDAMRLDLNAQIAATRSVAGFQVDRLRDPLVALADARTAEALRIVDTRTGQMAETLDARTAAISTSIDGLRTDLRPTLNAATALTKDAQDTLDALYPDVQAAVDSATVAATQTAQAAESVRQAMPKLLKTAQSLEENSNATTAYSANLMHNLAESTKPLPWWARIGLAVAPPVAQTGFTVASWAALKGR